MKNIFYYIVLLLFVSCDEKVDIALDTSTPKLVIDANIKWQKDTSGNAQTIRLTTTTDYYNATIPVVSGAIVTVKNSTNEVFQFIETPATGEYNCTNFAAKINEIYTLTVIYKSEIYSSTATLLATPKIIRVEQKTVQSFGGNRIQVKFYYLDNGLEENDYLLSFKNSDSELPNYRVARDKLFQGNEMFGFYSTDKLKTGDVLFMSVQAISGRQWNFMSKLISISGSQGGSPFSTPPATLRGNIINTSNEANYPYGYFSLGETDSRNYLVE